MRVRSLVVVGLLTIAPFLLGPVHHAVAAGTAEVEFSGGFPVTRPDRIYPLSEIKRGDRGVGYTVFAEDEIKPFQFEVLGVLEGMLGPKMDVILARLSGDAIEYTGVIAGMSGSPVYIDGRLVGAVSYRFGVFSREPIAGITPIESMLAIYGKDTVEPLSRAPGRGARPAPISVADFRSRDGLLPVTLPRMVPIVGPYDPKPIETPIMMSGLHPRVLEDLRQALEGVGFVTAAGGGATTVGLRKPRRVNANGPSQAGRVKAAPIAPGAPIAALIMRGDVNVAGIGTVTMVDGGRVLAFGHPFLGFGHTDLPMATSAILNTLATPVGSYKQGAAALEVGSITHDRLTAIAGRIGDVAPMVPVAVSVARFDQAPDDATMAHVEIADSPMWLPVMLEAIVASAAVNRLGYEAGGTVDMDVAIHVGGRTITFNDTYSAPPPVRLPTYVARDIGTTVATIARNALQDVEIRGIEAKLTLKSAVALSQIEDVVPDQFVIEAGQRLGLSVRLRPYQGDVQSVRMEVEIPGDAEGNIEVYVGGGVELDRRDGEVYGDRYPRDVDELLDILSDRRPGRAIFARAYVPRAGLRTDADLLSSLPPSQRIMLSADVARFRRASNETMGPTTSLPQRDVVVGGLAVPVTVVR